MLRTKNIAPKMYYHQLPTNLSNQEVYQYHYLKDILRKQQETQQEVTSSVHQFHSTLKENRDIYEQEAKKMVKSHQDLQEHIKNTFIQQKMNLDEMIKKIEHIESKYKTMETYFENERNMLEALIQQQAVHDKLLHTLAKRNDEEEKILSQFQVQHELLHDLHKKIELQEIYHQTLMERLDSHEGLLHKILSELDYIRSIIFERASHLLQKMELGFQKVTKPIQSFFIHGEKKEEKQLKEKEWIEK